MLSVRDLIDRLSRRLRLRPLGDWGLEASLKGDFPEASQQALLGPLNCIHPNRIQIIGHSELVYLADLGDHAYRETLDKLFECRPALVIFTDDIEAAPEFFDRAKETGVALAATPLPEAELISNLQYHLTHALADRITIHGVFVEILGMGVLLTGDSAVGKSELALALISRGHRLVADDAPQFAQIAPDILQGICPPLLRDFLEVRGLGILNIREMFGDSAVRRAKDLHLIVHLRRMGETDLNQMDQRLDGSHSQRDILGVEVPELTLPVAAGRNLEVLVEAAVRHHSLRMRGYNASQDFAERQAHMIEASTPARGDA